MGQKQDNEDLPRSNDQASARSTDYQGRQQHCRNPKIRVGLECEEKGDGENGLDEDRKVRMVNNRAHDEVLITGVKEAKDFSRRQICLEDGFDSNGEPKPHDRNADEPGQAFRPSR